MLALLTALTLAVEPVRLAAPGFSFVDLPEQKGALFADRLAKELERHGVRVTGRAEIEAAIGFERQKQLLGCPETATNCMAELAGALGTDGLLIGTLGRAGSQYVVSLKVVDANAISLGLASGRVASEEALLDFLDAAAEELARQLYAALGRERPAARPTLTVPDRPAAQVQGPPPAPQGSPLKVWPLPLAVGAAGLVAGGVLWGVAKGTELDLRRGLPVTDDAGLAARIAAGRTYETLGWVAGGVGLGLLAAGVAMAVVDRVQVSASVAPGGGGLLLTGALP
jgi:hypothetical protein